MFVDREFDGIEHFDPEILQVLFLIDDVPHHDFKIYIVKGDVIVDKGPGVISMGDVEGVVFALAHDVQIPGLEADLEVETHRFHEGIDDVVAFLYDVLRIETGDICLDVLAQVVFDIPLGCLFHSDVVIPVSLSFALQLKPDVFILGITVRNQHCEKKHAAKEVFLQSGSR
jgi:hypothetical protein